MTAAQPAPRGRQSLAARTIGLVLVPKNVGSSALPSGPVRENENPGASSGPVMR